MRPKPRLLRSAIVVVAAVAAFVGSSVTGPAKLAFAQKRAISGSLTGQMRMITARMVAGRFSAICPASNQSMTSNVNVPDRREKLSLNLAGGKPNIGYELSTSRERLSINIDQGDSLKLRLEPQNESNGAIVDFSQGATGVIRLTVSAGKDVREIQAQSIWQLMLIEPEVCQTHLIPLLQLIRPNWQLKEQSVAIEEMLCSSAEGQSAAERAAWQKAVVQLGSPRFAVRERAEQQLLEGGQRVLPMLQSLPRSQLDAEQTFRVRRVVKQLTGDGEEDTPNRVAFWLSEDPRVWYALASRDDVAKRRVAASRLTRILAAPIEFDPNAAAEVRADQLQRIREEHSEALDPQQQKGASYEPLGKLKPTPAQPARYGNMILDTF